MEIKFANVLMKKFQELCSVIWDPTKEDKSKIECFQDSLKEDYPDDWQLIFETSEKLLSKAEGNFGTGKHKKSCILYQAIQCKNGEEKIIEIIKYNAKPTGAPKMIPVTLIKILNSNRDWESEYTDGPLIK